MSLMIVDEIKAHSGSLLISSPVTFSGPLTVDELITGKIVPDNSTSLSIRNSADTQDQSTLYDDGSWRIRKSPIIIGTDPYTAGTAAIAQGTVLQVYGDARAYGANPVSVAMYLETRPQATSTSQVDGIRMGINNADGATSGEMAGIRIGIGPGVGSTVTKLWGIFIAGIGKGSGHIGTELAAIRSVAIDSDAVTNYGLFLGAVSGASVNNYGIFIGDVSGTGAFAIKTGLGMVSFGADVTIASSLSVTTGPFTAGAAKIGSRGTDAFFGNSALDQSVVGNNALFQDNTGSTFLNAASGKTAWIRVNNQNIASFSITPITFYTSTLLTGAGVGFGMNTSDQHLGVGKNFRADTGVDVSVAMTGNTTQLGMNMVAIGDSAATVAISGIRVTAGTAAASFTTTALHGIRIFDASKGAGSTITTQVGLRIEDQTQGATNYAILTGAGLVRFGGASVYVPSGVISIGDLAPDTSIALQMHINTTLTSTNQEGIIINLTGSSAATSNIHAIDVLAATAPVAFSCTLVAGVYVRSNLKGAGSTIGANYGVFIDAQNAGTTNAGLAIGDVSGGTANYSIFTGAGVVRLGDDVKLLNQKNLTWRNSGDTGDVKVLTCNGFQVQLGVATAGGVTSIIMGIPGSTILTIDGVGSQFAGYIGMSQAPNAVAMIGILQATGAAALAVNQQSGVTAHLISASGGTITGSAAPSILSVAQTWNTSGNPIAFNIAITKTATGGSSKMFQCSIIGVGALLAVSAENGRVDIGNTLVMQNLFAQAYGITVGQSTFDGSAMLRLTGLGSPAVTSDYGIFVDAVASVSTTVEHSSIFVRPTTAAASFTCATVAGLHVADATKGAGSTITTQYGILIDNQTQGGTNFAIKTGTGLVQFGDNVNIVSGKALQVNATQVVAARRTGWTAWTGTADRTSHNADGPATVTQLGQALKALLDDLIAHGLIGA